MTPQVVRAEILEKKMVLIHDNYVAWVANSPLAMQIIQSQSNKYILCFEILVSSFEEEWVW